MPEKSENRKEELLRKLEKGTITDAEREELSSLLDQRD